MTGIGERIKARRKELGMTLEDISKKVGFGTALVPFLEKVENGEEDALPGKIYEWAKILDTTTDYLSGREEKEREDERKKLEEAKKRLEAEHLENLETFREQVDRGMDYLNILTDRGFTRSEALEFMKVLLLKPAMDTMNDELHNIMINISWLREIQETLGSGM